MLVQRSFPVQRITEVKPKFYNPCADGFAAKAWECLRRNKNFKEALGGQPEYDRYGSLEWFNWNIDITEDMFPFHREALVMLNGYDPLLVECIWDSGVSLEQSWQILTQDSRNRLHDTFLRQFPYRFPVPKIETISHLADPKYYSESESRNFFGDLKECLETHELIAVPKFIWDTRHIREIIDEFKKLLSKPRGNVKLLKPTGSTLCTEHEWSTFLDYEEWTRLGFKRQDAANLAAERQRVIKAENPLYGFKVTQGTDVERKKAAKNFLNKKKPHAHRTRAEKRISDVEKAIASVFPSFSIFSSK